MTKSFEKGQSTVEVLIIAVVVLGLVLLTYSVVLQRNSDAARILALRKDNERCEEISGIITAFSAGENYTETSFGPMEKDVHVEKGSVIIQSSVSGSVSCLYSGTALLEVQDNVFQQDSAGFDLVRQKAGNNVVYKAKRLPTGVTFCDYSEAWC